MRNFVACFLNVTHVTNVTEIHAQFLNTPCISSVSELSRSRMTYKRENSKKAQLQILDVSVCYWKNDDKDWEKLLLQYTVSHRSKISWTGRWRWYIGTIVNFFFSVPLSLLRHGEMATISNPSPNGDNYKCLILYVNTLFKRYLLANYVYSTTLRSCTPWAHLGSATVTAAYWFQATKLFSLQHYGEISVSTIINLVRASDKQRQAGTEPVEKLKLEPFLNSVEMPTSVNVIIINYQNKKTKCDKISCNVLMCFKENYRIFSTKLWFLLMTLVFIALRGFHHSIDNVLRFHIQYNTYQAMVTSGKFEFFLKFDF